MHELTGKAADPGLRVFIREIYITPHDLSVRRVAKRMKVSPSTLTRLLNGDSNMSPEMALRLSSSGPLAGELDRDAGSI